MVEPILSMPLSSGAPVSGAQVSRRVARSKARSVVMQDSKKEAPLRRASANDPAARDLTPVGCAEVARLGEKP